MAKTYNLYDTEAVKNAEDNYNNVANSAPSFNYSNSTLQAKQQADSYANKYLNEINNGYQSKYGDTINTLTDKYVNNKFDFNVNNSSEYQSASEKNKREGSIAQENIQGSYAANTGGYGNSYAQAAGQKAYNNYMDHLASLIPSLNENARQQWSQQQEQTINNIGLMQNLDETAYSRYRDKVADNYDFMQYYANKYNTEAGLDMSAFQNELNRWQARLSATVSNMANIRDLAERQYEHQNVSADTQASINSDLAQSQAYYDYLYSKLK